MSHRALLHQEWFLLLCPRHRPDSITRVSKGTDTVICDHGPTPDLTARLENGDTTGNSAEFAVFFEMTCC